MSKLRRTVAVFVVVGSMLVGVSACATPPGESYATQNSQSVTAGFIILILCGLTGNTIFAVCPKPLPPGVGL
jgi:hypothetical protein